MSICKWKPLEINNYSIKSLWTWTLADIIFFFSDIIFDWKWSHKNQRCDIAYTVMLKSELTGEFLPACCWACKWARSGMTQLSACAYCFISKLVVTGVSCHTLWWPLQACLVYHFKMSSDVCDPDSTEYNQMPLNRGRGIYCLLTHFTVYRVISPLASEIFFQAWLWIYKFNGFLSQNWQEMWYLV